MGQENLNDTALYRENGAAAWRASRASSKVTEAVRQQVQSWIGKQADLTLAELQLRLYEERNLEISLSRLWTVLGEMGLRLKKSRFTPPSKTRQRGSSSAASGAKKPVKLIHRS